MRQGKADEFTLKAANERKEILGNILGLSDYDLLEEKAREKQRETLNKINTLEYQLMEIQAELLTKEEREKSLSQAEAEVKKTESDLFII